MDELETPSILAVGAKLANLARAKATGDVGGQVSMAEVDSAREALHLLRVLPFDLVAIGPNVLDMTAGQFARRLQQARPWQKWLMVADELVTPAQEIEARTLGAMAVLEGPDAWRDVLEAARRVRQRNPATGVPGFQLTSSKA